jgi:hypothetical protein
MNGESLQFVQFVVFRLGTTQQQTIEHKTVIESKGRVYSEWDTVTIETFEQWEMHTLIKLVSCGTGFTELYFRGISRYF